MWRTICDVYAQAIIEKEKKLTHSLHTDVFCENAIKLLAPQLTGYLLAVESSTLLNIRWIPFFSGSN